MSEMGLSSLDGEILDLLRFASERSILPRWKNLAEEDVDLKAQDDPVTIADKEVEEFLTEALTRLAPDVPVVGEEAAHADPSILDRLAGPCWIIDPIDGTSNYAAGESPFGTIIALADGGKAIASWIFDPIRQRFCHARNGDGAFINGEKVTARPTGQDLPVAAIAKQFLDEEERAFMDARLSAHYTVVDIPRCAAEQYPRLALGENDVSTFKRTLAWDHAAGVLWLNEAGGKATRTDGSAYRVDEPDKTGLIAAASPSIWDAFVARISVAND